MPYNHLILFNFIMPVTKAAGIRYRILDGCLRDRSHSWTLQQMTDEVSVHLMEELGSHKGISASTIEKDLRFMRSSAGFLAPIETEKVGNQWVWYYNDCKFSITNSPLDRDDARKLKEVIELLRAFENLPQLRDLEEMLLKLESRTAITGKNRRPVLQVETNPLAVGNRHLRVLYQKITRRQALHITYRPFYRESRLCRLSPYLLKEYSNRWFLFGKNHDTKTIQNLALDRIVQIEPGEFDFMDDPDFDPNDYFRDVVGVSVSTSSPETIRLRFTPEQANYVITKPLHASQKITKQTRQYLDIELCLIINYELKKLIWSFGDTVEVLEPADLLARQFRK